MEKMQKQHFWGRRAAITNILDGTQEDNRVETLRVFVAALNDYLAPYGEQATVTIRPLVAYPETTCSDKL